LPIFDYMKKIYKNLWLPIVVLSVVFLSLSCKEDTTVYRTSYYREDEGRTGHSLESPLNAFHDVEQKINLGNQIYSSLMMDETYLYVSTIDAIYFLSKEDFQVVNKFAHKDGKMIVSPPITEKNIIYITDRSGGITAMNKLNGNSLWRRGVEGNVYGSPVLWGGMLHVVTSAYPDTAKSGSYYQINTKKPGLVKNKLQLPDNVLNSPAVSGTNIVFYTHSGILLCYDMQSLSLLWSEDVYPENLPRQPSDEFMVSPVISGGCVYVTDPRGIAYAFDLYSGQRLWAVSIGSYTDVSPAVYDGNMYFGAENGFYCLNTQDGSVRFVFKETGSRVTTGAIIAGSTVYFGTDAGRVFALDIKNGELLWDFQIPYPEDISMYVDPNSDYEQSEYAPTPSVSLSITADPLIYDKRVFIGCFDYHLYILN